jgi:hypothetical protein
MDRYHGNESVQWGSRGNEYASGHCIRKQETEEFDKVLSTRLANDCRKEMQTQIGTVKKRQSTGS